MHQKMRGTYVQRLLEHARYIRATPTRTGHHAGGVCTVPCRRCVYCTMPAVCVLYHVGCGTPRGGVLPSLLVALAFERAASPALALAALLLRLLPRLLLLLLLLLLPPPLLLLVVVLLALALSLALVLEP